MNAHELTRPKLFQQHTPAAIYSEAECLAFWTQHLKPTVVDTFLSRKYSIPEISNRITELQALLLERFGTLHVNIYTGYVVQDERILATCSITNGLPIMAIVIPAAMDLFKKMHAERPGEQRELFNLMLGVTMIHEMEHAAYGYIGTNTALPLTLSERVNFEKRTWALTCEQSLSPLVEKHHKVLPPGLIEFYEHWVKAGRNVESPLWAEFIRDVHR